MYNTVDFSKRLRELLEEKSVTPKEVSKAIGYYQIYCWLNSDYMPSFENLIKLADYFDCTFEYLLGLSEENPQGGFKPCPSFSERLRALTNEKKMTVYRLIKTSKIRKATVYDWLSGKNSPRVDHLLTLASVFDCSLDYLIGREK